MMDTKMVHGMVIVVMIMLGNFRVCGQQKIPEGVEEYYSRFHTSNVMGIDALRHWILVRHWNPYGKNDMDVINLQTGKTQRLPQADSYTFTTENKMVMFRAGKAVLFKDLLTGQEKEMTGSYIVNILPAARKVVLYEKEAKVLLVCDTEGNILIHKNQINKVEVDKDHQVVLATDAEKWFRLNLTSFDMKTTKIENPLEWFRSSDHVARGLFLQDNGVILMEWNTKKESLLRINIEVPNGFTIATHYPLYTEIREDRYLILPLVKKIAPQTNLVQISYSNMNGRYKVPFRQIAVFDLIKKEWKHLPGTEDLFFTQDFVNESGDFIHYDKVTSNRDTLNNNRTKISLVKKYGEKSIALRNPYYNKDNFKYDVFTNKMLYFEEGKWWIHDLTTDSLALSSLPENVTWRSDIYSGLSDEPQAAAVPWTEKGVYILQEKYDLYLLNLANNSWRKLTSGRADNIRYSVYRSRDDLENRRQEPYIIKMFNTSNYNSGFAILQPNGTLKKEVYGNFVVKDAWLREQSLLYTTESYQQPFEIHWQSKKINKTLYKSEGITEGKLPVLKKELFQYRVQNGKKLNAVLLYPSNYDSGKIYPMVVDVYENNAREILSYRIPHLRDGRGFNCMHYIYQNYFVLLPDLDYETGNVGEAIVNSVVAVTREAKERAPIDSSKIAIIGSSFGGYESTLLIGMTDIFKTAVAGVAVVDLPRATMSYIRDFKQPEFWRVERQQHRMDKNLFGNWPLYLENSPIYHLPKVTQPVLLWTGKEDGNINPDQSRAYFLGLQRLGKKGVLLEYPEEGHNIMEKNRQSDLNVKVWEWLDYFLKEKTPAPWLAPLLQKAVPH